MRWSANLAYAVGLIATDGNLSKDGRHIDLTSKDLEQIENFVKILKLKNKIGIKTGGFSEKRYYRVQFGDVRLYRFLIKIGLTPNKSKILGKIIISDKYFRDFLRGCLDGDGYNYFYWDPRWKNSFMFYTGFVSGSEAHLRWLNAEIHRLYGLEGKIRFGQRAYQLKFAKRASLKLMSVMYYSDKVICLKRKHFKINEALGIIHQQAGVAKLVHAID